ncbi:hypothetical protein [Candidatus Mycoplasma haematohominis]|uniref:hypothetical protein n=1 Tax=Candidatus Mycoplasma haematohominis TaxID=1494318 RepID=UPI001C0A751D|nr:hypothetical protein [Candidatus Mycoplasma haemohominis]
MALIKAIVIGGSLVAIGGGGGYYIFTLFDEPAPKVSIKEAIAGKFGDDFQLHFMDATGNENDIWWQTRFEHIESIGTLQNNGKTNEDELLSDEFKKNVINNIEKLKEVCRTAYGKATSEIHIPGDTSSDKENKKKYEQNIWSFCSIEGSMPITVESSEQDEYKKYKTDGTDVAKFGGTKKESLISTKDGKNNLFWEIQAKAFFAGKINLSENSSPFKTLKEKTVKALKEVCESKYQSTGTEQDTLKVCSLKGKNHAGN